MDLADIITIVVYLIVTVAGSGGLAAWIANKVADHASQKWLQENQAKLSQALETHRAELAKETEVHKLSLKRQELLFARELEAADAFMAMWRKVWPQYSRPDMEWHEACEDVADRLGSVEELFEDYLEKHSVAISADVRNQISGAQSVAASEKFFENGPDFDPPPEAVQAAEKVLNAMQVARNAILADLRR